MDENPGRTTVLRWFDALNRRDLDALGGCVADGVVFHYAGTEGREAYLAYFQALFEAFPDLHAEVLATTGGDGLVATRARFSGTHQGEFGGIPATGRPVAMESAEIFGADAGGRITEHWTYADSMVMMRQLGVVPEPA